VKYSVNRYQANSAIRLLNVGALHAIPPSAARSVVEKRRDAWMYLGTARKYTQSWFELSSGGRTFETCHGTPRTHANAGEALDRLLKR
jgi:hypothetical protein